MLTKLNYMNDDPGPRKVLISKNWQSAGVRTSIFQDSSRDEKGARHLVAGYPNFCAVKIEKFDSNVWEMIYTFLVLSCSSKLIRTVFFNQETLVISWIVTFLRRWRRIMHLSEITEPGL